MFKKFFVLIVLLTAVFYNQASSDPLVASTDLYRWETVEKLTDAAWDTITATADACTLFTNFKLSNSWEYILTIAPFTGTGSDSVDVDVTIKGYTSDGVEIVRQVFFDTKTTAYAEQILIPMGSEMGGADNWVCYYYGSDDVGTQIILNETYLMRRQKYSINLPTFYGQ